MTRKVLFAPLVCSLCLLAGCGGQKLVPTEGNVKIDGKAVEGATVTFISDDGLNTFSGTTDAAGHFALQSGQKIEALPGNYKVTVVKSPNKPGDEAPDPSGAGMKQMKKDEDEAAKAAAKAAKGGGGGDMKSKMASGVPSGGKTGVVKTEKSELPIVYATGTNTPLKATVPSSAPIELELKSKP